MATEIETTTTQPRPFDETSHVTWVALPTKRHLPGEDIDWAGTGEDGWGIHLADCEEEGYFAWLPHQAAAEELVRQHNEAVGALEEAVTTAADYGGPRGLSPEEMRNERSQLLGPRRQRCAQGVGDAREAAGLTR